MHHLKSCGERRLVRLLIFSRSSGIASAAAAPPAVEHLPVRTSRQLKLTKMDWLLGPPTAIVE